MLRRLLAAAVLLLAMFGVATADPARGAQDDPAYIRIAALIDESAALSLPIRVERAFLLTLNGASEAIRHEQYARAVTLMRTFAFEVRSVKRARRIPAGVADALIEKAEQLIATMTGQAPQ